MVSSVMTRTSARRICKISQQRAYTTSPRQLPRLDEKIGEKTAKSGGQGRSSSGGAGQGTGAKAFSWLSLTAMSIGAGYVIGCTFPTDFALLMRPRPPAALPGPESKEGRIHSVQIEKQADQLDIVRTMREKVKEGGWKETRPYAEGTIEEDRRTHNLVGGILRGPGRFAIPAICFSSDDNKESIYVIHVGRSLCGHDGIVHGGLLATMLDEGMARPALMSLPSRVGVTANLELNYRKPSKAGQFVVMRVQCTKLEGRKAYTVGSIEDIKGQLLVEATSLYIEPKIAGYLPGAKRLLGLKGV